ncbi:MAG: hypothetical protein AB1591_02750 [Pseudomonadota bacterium]
MTDCEPIAQQPVPPEVAMPAPPEVAPEPVPIQEQPAPEPAPRQSRDEKIADALLQILTVEIKITKQTGLHRKTALGEFARAMLSLPESERMLPLVQAVADKAPEPVAAMRRHLARQVLRLAGVRGEI